MSTPKDLLGFEISDNLRAIADQFEGQLSSTQVRKALANALSAALTQSKKEFIKASRASHHIPKDKLLEGYKQKRPKASADVIEATQSFQSKPLELKYFVTNQKPVTTYIKQSKTFDRAFVLKSIGEHVFERDGTKSAPKKGLYAGRRITRGERKGELLQRERVQKLYTTTTAHIAHSNADEVLKALKLEELFKAKLEQQVAKAMATQPPSKKS